jgi:thiamine biosynthesis lipoprotein
MNKKFITPTIIIVAVVAAVLLYNEPEKEYKKIEGSTQGTTYHITYEYNKNKDLHDDIKEVLHNFDLSLSTYDSSSVIARINANDPDVEADEKFIRVFEEAREVNEKTNGAFDITVAPVVNALGFGFTGGIEVDSAVIDSLLQYVGMEKVRLAGNKIVKDHPFVMLDVNAIAQGYSVDVVAEFLDGKKVDNYLVEIGGELKCKGMNPKGEDWKIGIDRPVEGNYTPGKDLQAIVAIRTKSLATSGNYRKFYEKGGVKYAHSIDPNTGYPVLSRLLSATVLAGECITADAYATACMVMGLEKSIALLEEQEELEAYLIYSDEEGNFRVYTTPGMKEHIVREIE